MTTEAQTSFDVRTETEKLVDEANAAIPQDVLPFKDWQDIEDVEEIVTVQLTEKEKAETLDKVAKLTTEHNKDQSEFKRIKSEWKEQLDGQKALIESLIQKAEKGEDRSIVCTKRLNFAENKTQFFQGGVIFKEREMLPEEKQLQLEPHLKDKLKKQDSDEWLQIVNETKEDLIARGELTADVGADFDGVDFNAQHAAAKEAQERDLVDESEELEPITPRHLTENRALGF